MPSAVDFLSNAYHNLRQNGEPEPTKVYLSSGLYHAYIDELGANVRFQREMEGRPLFRGMPVYLGWQMEEWTYMWLGQNRQQVARAPVVEQPVFDVTFD